MHGLRIRSGIVVKDHPIVVVKINEVVQERRTELEDILTKESFHAGFDEDVLTQLVECNVDLFGKETGLGQVLKCHSITKASKHVLLDDVILFLTWKKLYMVEVAFEMEKRLVVGILLTAQPRELRIRRIYGIHTMTTDPEAAHQILNDATVV